MKILHITTIRSGSTGRTATDLKSFLNQKGNQYKIAFSEKDAKALDDDILIGNRFDHLLHAFFSRLFGLQGYFSFFATKRFLRQVNLYKPDIVVLGNLHANYINLPVLFNYLALERIPVVMILHDCWFFTGKCTHFTYRDCNKWKVQCHHCPAIKIDNLSWFSDCSRKMFKDRELWYKRLSSLTVVSVSEWEKNLAIQSPLFKAAKIGRIYNWIDTNTYKPATQEDIQRIMKKYNLSESYKYLISVGGAWNPSSSKIKDSIKFSFLLPDNYRLIIVGSANHSAFPKNIIHIPYISNSSELAVLYSLSSAYLHFSVEDTFGKVIAEAMACGTVPVVYDSTACPETAGPYGIVVPTHDVNAMVSKLADAENPIRRIGVRRYALDYYSRSTNINMYIETVFTPLLN